MTCFRKILRIAAPFSLAAALLTPGALWGHGVAGQRFFPTTFAVDDPFVSDEFSALYNYQKLPGDGGASTESSSLDIGISKRITPEFGLEIDEPYSHLHTEGDGSASGFGDLGLTLKYQFYTSAEHETILSAGVTDAIGRTGAARVGADSFSTLSPDFFFGKGFGDLPERVRYLKPLAITGVIGPNVPLQGTTDGVRNPATFTWAFTLQYSLMYLQTAVKDVGLSAPLNRMVLIVEFPMETCLDGDCRNQTTGTVNPGLAWIGKYAELGIATQVPVNRNSGKDVGVFGLVHFFIDDLLPGAIGRPLFP